jgi:hypothetical protein
VERWRQFFPREQFLFLRFEDLAARPQDLLDSVYEFLGLPGHRLAEFPKRNAGRYEAMKPETRAALTEYFRPHNERLAALTGIDWRWDSDPGEPATPRRPATALQAAAGAHRGESMLPRSL